MMGKLTMLAGFGAGYVLGARAGRQRYEQIRSSAQRLWQDPRVQQKTQQAAHLAKEQGMVAKEKVQEKVHAHNGAGTADGSTQNGVGSAPTWNQ